MSGIYREAFEPVAQIEDFVELIGSKGHIGYYRITFVETLPEYIVDFGSVSAGASIEAKQPEELKMRANEFAQYRFEVLDDVEVTARQPKAISRWSTEKVMFKVTPLTKPENLTEHFVFEDNPPFYTIFNPTSYDLPRSRLRFKGFRYTLEKVVEKPEKYIVIPVEGRG